MDLRNSARNLVSHCSYSCCCCHMKVNSKFRKRGSYSPFGGEDEDSWVHTMVVVGGFQLTGPQIIIIDVLNDWASSSR